jgi:hypothetical protein
MTTDSIDFAAIAKSLDQERLSSGSTRSTASGTSCSPWCGSPAPTGKRTRSGRRRPSGRGRPVANPDWRPSDGLVVALAQLLRALARNECGPAPCQRPARVMTTVTDTPVSPEVCNAKCTAFGDI